jgi:hypothetical protein
LRRPGGSQILNMQRAMLFKKENRHGRETTDYR